MTDDELIIELRRHLRRAERDPTRLPLSVRAILFAIYRHADQPDPDAPTPATAADNERVAA